MLGDSKNKKQELLVTENTARFPVTLYENTRAGVSIFWPQKRDPRIERERKKKTVVRGRSLAARGRRRRGLRGRARTPALTDKYDKT